MTNNIENLMLEHFRKLREDISGLNDGQLEIKAEILSMKNALHDIRGEALRREHTIAGIQLDLDRIKRRLDLTDA